VVVEALNWGKFRMKQPIRWKRSATLVAALAFVISACGGSTDEPSAPAPTPQPTEEAPSTELETTSIRLATSPPDFETLTDVYWIKLLEEAGLTVETFEFESSPDTVRAVAAGEGDVINTSPLAIMQYIQQNGGGLTIVGVELLTTDYVLLAQKGIETLADLEGEIIGISTPGDLSDSLTRLMLKNAGVDPESVEYAQIGGTSARVAALGAGQIAGGAAHVLNALVGAREFDLQILAQYGDYVPGYAQRFLAMNPEWMAAHPNTAQLLVDKMIEAQRWAQDNREEFIALGLEELEGLPEDLANEAYDVFMSYPEFFAVNGGMDKIGPTAEVEIAQGNLDAAFLDSYDEWVDSSFVERSLERLGRY